MGAFTERLALLVDARTDGAVRGLKKLDGSAKASARTADATQKKYNNLSTGLKVGIGVAAGLAARKLLQFSGEAINAARDQGEALNKSNVIFGQNAKSVEKWAAGGAKAFGLSETAALDAAGSFGNMFDQLGFAGDATKGMSQRMVQLAADFASFHNADITDVLEAQQAAFRGEYDALQRFVPTISAATVQQEAMAETGKKNATQLTAQEKAAATYQLILKNAGQAQGDFARTSDSLANKQRIMNAQWDNAKADLGRGLLPAMTAATGAASKLLGVFGDMDPTTQKLVVGLSAAGVAALVLGPRIVAITTAIKEMGAASITTAKGVGTLGVTFLAVGVAEDFAKKKINDLADAHEGFVQKGLRGAEEGLAIVSGGLIDLRDKSDDAKTGTDDLKAAQDQYQQLLNSSVTPALQDATTATDDLYKKQKLLNGELLTVTESEIDFRDKLKQWTDEVKNATEAGEKHTHSLSLGTQAGRDNQSALLDLITAANDHADAVYNQTGSVDKANEALKTDRRRLIEAATAAGFNKDEVQKLINKYLKVPSNVSTKIRQPGMPLAQTNAAGLRKKMGELDRSFSSRVNVSTSGTGKLDALQAKINAVTGAFSLFLSVTGATGIFGGGRQHGGPVRPHEAYLVGERQAEVFVPDRPGRILPSVSRLAHVGAGAGGVTNITFNFPNYVGSRHELVEALRKEIRVNGGNVQKTLGYGRAA